MSSHLPSHQGPCGNAAGCCKGTGSSAYWNSFSCRWRVCYRLQKKKRAVEVFLWIGWGPDRGREATLLEFSKIEDTFFRCLSLTKKVISKNFFFCPSVWSLYHKNPCLYMTDFFAFVTTNLKIQMKTSSEESVLMSSCLLLKVWFWELEFVQTVNLIAANPDVSMPFALFGDSIKECRCNCFSIMITCDSPTVKRWASWSNAASFATWDLKV